MFEQVMCNNKSAENKVFVDELKIKAEGNYGVKYELDPLLVSMY